MFVPLNVQTFLQFPDFVELFRRTIFKLGKQCRWIFTLWRDLLCLRYEMKVVGETSVIGSYFNFMAWQFVQCFQKSSGLRIYF